ncbi:hypothetical protein C8F01DRAFT_1093335 [Mycena amicta]|nr:hypothetical protein C8F01DRAFT_1093335 [Mycena amicta]
MSAMCQCCLRTSSAAHACLILIDANKQLRQRRLLGSWVFLQRIYPTLTMLQVKDSAAQLNLYDYLSRISTQVLRGNCQRYLSGQEQLKLVLQNISRLIGTHSYYLRIRDEHRINLPSFNANSPNVIPPRGGASRPRRSALVPTAIHSEIPRHRINLPSFNSHQTLYLLEVALLDLHRWISPGTNRHRLVNANPSYDSELPKCSRAVDILPCLRSDVSDSALFYRIPSKFDSCAGAFFDLRRRHVCNRRSLPRATTRVQYTSSCSLRSDVSDSALFKFYASHSGLTPVRCDEPSSMLFFKAQALERRSYLNARVKMITQVER